MDRRVPISSLFDAAVSTKKVCWAITTTATDITQYGAGNGDSARRFVDESRALNHALEGVSVSTGKIAKLPSFIESENDKEVWTSVYNSVCGCGRYLRELMPLLIDIQNSNEQSASLAMRAKRSRINQEDFDASRIKISRYTKKLQLALTMINL